MKNVVALYLSAKNVEMLDVKAVIAKIALEILMDVAFAGLTGLILKSLAEQLISNELMT